MPPDERHSRRWLPGLAQAAPTNTTGPVDLRHRAGGADADLAPGAWTDTTDTTVTITVSDQWESCAGATCTAVGTANSTSYVVAASDVGNTIQVVETASTASDGSASATSNATGTVTLRPLERRQSQEPPNRDMTLTASSTGWSQQPDAHLPMGELQRRHLHRGRH